ncbi:hypothetical protein [Kribbella sp. CA-247076]|uniref:hypothetical protein n=1 Tax=Kribbella sp. CA-247076 TaxID=3239941 RepID=UPI003D94E76F
MLPNTITTYLTTPSIDLFAEHAEVTDEGKTHRGRAEIRAWLDRSASEYTYTTELVDTRQLDANTWVAVNHLEGNFPGGTVDLNFTFTLDNNQITHLVIAP